MKATRMVVRIRWKRGSALSKVHEADRRLAAALGALLSPAALMVSALAVWGVAADLGWTGPFPIVVGPFSHWQVWLALSIGLFFCSSLLSRYGRPVAESDPSSSYLS